VNIKKISNTLILIFSFFKKKKIETKAKNIDGVIKLEKLKKSPNLAR
jgi:hypothetical protein